MYVAWDHEGPKEEYHSFEKFGARFLKPLHGWDVLHDSWVLVKADYLIVNTASSVGIFSILTEAKKEQTGLQKSLELIKFR